MSSTREIIRAAAVECLVMAMFVWVGTGAAVAANSQVIAADAGASTVGLIAPIAMAFGFGIMVLAYGVGHITGGHINPAVTLALTLIGECEPVRCALYMVGQFVGAVIGSLLVWASFSDMAYTTNGAAGNPPFNIGANILAPTLNQGNGFVLEVMGTLVLILTVFNTVLHKDSLTQGQPNMAPFAIGMAVMLAHLVLVPTSSAGINPARTFGPAVVSSIAGSNDGWASSCWIFYIGPFCASVIGAVLHKTLLVPAKVEDESSGPTKTESSPPPAQEQQTVEA